jgi:hypothetical protein
VVQALNARDGSHMWTFTVRAGVCGMGFADPPGLAAGQGCVYVAVDRLYCLRAGDGAKVWSDPYPLTVNLAAGPDAVYAVQATLFALSSHDGTRLWSFAANAGSMPAPLLADGVIYVLGYGTQSNVVAAIRASDGARLWDSPGPGGGWLACDGKTVCAVSGVGPDVQIQGNAGPLPTQMWTYRASDGNQASANPAADKAKAFVPARVAAVRHALAADRDGRSRRARMNVLSRRMLRVCAQDRRPSCRERRRPVGLRRPGIGRRFTWSGDLRSSVSPASRSETVPSKLVVCVPCNVRSGPALIVCALDPREDYRRWDSLREMRDQRISIAAERQGHGCQVVE